MWLNAFKQPPKTASFLHSNLILKHYWTCCGSMLVKWDINLCRLKLYRLKVKICKKNYILLPALILTQTYSVHFCFLDSFSLSPFAFLFKSCKHISQYLIKRSENIHRPSPQRIQESTWKWAKEMDSNNWCKRECVSVICLWLIDQNPGNA